MKPVDLYTLLGNDINRYENLLVELIRFNHNLDVSVCIKVELKCLE